MSVKLLTEHRLEFVSLKGGCTGSSESTLVRMPHCVTAQFMIYMYSDRERHAPCAIVPLKTEMSHRFLQWMRPGLFPIFTIIFGTK